MIDSSKYYDLHAKQYLSTTRDVDMTSTMPCSSRLSLLVVVSLMQGVVVGVIHDTSLTVETRWRPLI